MKTKKVTEVKETSFEDIKQGINSTNEAALAAIAERNNAAEKGPAKRLGENDEQAIKSAKKDRSIAATVDNGKKFNANIATFEPQWLSNNVLIVLENSASNSCIGRRSW